MIKPDITLEADDVDYCPRCGKMLIACRCSQDELNERQHNEHSGSKASEVIEDFWGNDGVLNL